MKLNSVLRPMRQTIRQSLFLLIGVGMLLTILFTQCRKDPRIPFCELYPNECIEMKHIKDHYYFKTGSYWIYREETTGQIDSQWVSQAWSDGCKFDLKIKSSLDDYDRHRWTHLLTPSENCGTVEKRKVAYIERSKGKAGDFVGTSYIGMFYPVIGDSMSNLGGGGFPSETYRGILKVNSIYPDYIHLNSVYHNVIEISDEYNIIENSQPTIHFYAEGIGLIRKELLDSDQVWLLVKYNIEQ